MEEEEGRRDEGRDEMDDGGEEEVREPVMERG